MLKLETKSDLERLKNDDIQKSVTLDYKGAAALGKTSPQRSELCKDVSAFANSAGGQIIYGIQEDGHHPVRVQDVDAVDPADISREWIEQVIDSNVQPRIQNLRIHPSTLRQAAWPTSLRFRRQRLTLLTRLLTTNTTIAKTSSRSRWRTTRSATQCGERPRPSFTCAYRCPAARPQESSLPIKPRCLSPSF